MLKCPHCHADLAENDIALGECAFCANPLVDQPLKPSDDEAVADAEQRADGQTKLQPGAPLTATNKQGNTWLTDSEAELSSEGVHAEDAADSEAAAEAEPGARRIDATIDSAAGPAEPPADVEGETPAGRVDQTIASSLAPGPQLPADPATPNIDSVIGGADVVDQTIDSAVQLPPEPAAGSVTPTMDSGVAGDSDAAAIDRTIESGYTPGDAGPGAIDRTIDSSVSPSDSPPTIDSSLVEADGAVDSQEGWVIRKWGQAATGRNTGMTIRSDSGAAKPNDSTLVIQEREVGQLSEESAGYLDYDLKSIIGTGGMGVVYSARQASLDRDVAVKMLQSKLNADAHLKQKFLSEAIITGELDHPGIIPIYDMGSTREGALFYSMKQVHGSPWSEVIRKKTLADNLEILMKVCDATAFAHSRDVIHRDLKPENVILGDFGEVLVLDWGLAAYIGDDSKSRRMARMTTMGGTPAYMAPEMASGPFEAIGKHSDVYLLGAVLYECITGHFPRLAETTSRCLMMAMRNTLEPTEKKGELVNIALRAMAKDSGDRYSSVQEFQTAIREYQSHLESIAMTARAAEDLAAASQSRSYRDYARALFGFEEAHELWPNNRTAAESIVRAKLAYASAAYRNADFDLGLSLLDEDNPAHAAVRGRLLAGQEERDARTRRLRMARRVTVGLTALIALIIGGSSWLVWGERNKAMDERDNARRAEAVAIDARNAATQSESAALRAKEQALSAQRAEAEQRRVAEQERQTADDQREVAERQRQRAEQEAYVALIGLAAAKIDEQAFNQATQLLQLCRQDLRGWEWGRLMHLCRLRDRYGALGGRTQIESVATDTDQELVAAVGADGVVRVWRPADGEGADPIAELPLGRRGWAVAFSPDDPSLLAIGAAAGELRLWNHATGEQRTLAGHDGDVLCLTFSPDGRELLTGSKDHTARLWDVAGASLLRTYRGHSWWVWDVAFAPSEGPSRNKLATASQDGTVIVWDRDREAQPTSPTTGEPLPFRGHLGPVFSVAFSPNGELIASAGLDQRILLWRVADLAPFDFQKLVAVGSVEPQPLVAELQGHSAAVRSLDFSGDGKILISGGSDNAIKVWSAVEQRWDGQLVSRGALLKTLRGHSSQVRSAIFAAGDSDRLVTGGYDESIRRWSIREYEEHRVVHQDEILSADFAPDGNLVITGSRDRTARLSDAHQDRVADELQAGHQFLVSDGAFHPGGRSLYTAAGDGSVRIWSRDGGQELHVVEQTGTTGALALAPNGKWLITPVERQSFGQRERSRRASMAIYNVAGPQPQRVRFLSGHEHPVTTLAVSSDSRWLLSGDLIGRARVWDLAAVTADPASSSIPVYRLDHHTRRITDGLFLRHSSTVVTASSDGNVCRWTLAADRAVKDTRRLIRTAGDVALAATPDDAKLLIGDDAGLHLWDWESAREEWSWQADSQVTTVGISPDGKYGVAIDSALQGTASTVRLWRLADHPAEVPRLFRQENQQLSKALFSPSGESILVLGGDGGNLWSVGGSLEMTYSPHRTIAFASFSPNMERILTAGWDNTIRVWDQDVAEGKTIIVNRELAQDDIRARVNMAVYSADERYILSGGEDGVVRLFDAVSGLPNREFSGHTAGVTFAGFLAGDRLLSASRDGTARIWSLPTGETLQTFSATDGVAVLFAAMSPDGRHLVTSQSDMRAIVWDVESAAQKMVLDGHTGAVTCATFSPGAGTRVVTGSEDSSAKVWDVHRLYGGSQEAPELLAEAKELLTLGGHTRGVTAVSFSQDGRRILTAGRDGLAIIWPSVEW